MKRFRACSVDQPLLLAPSLHDWLPERHLARFVARVVEEIDLGPILDDYARKDGRGQAAYHPEMMVRLLVYCYAIGQRSSRGIEEATHDNVAVRYLAADQHPDHSSIAGFRQRHLDALAGLFVEVLRLCQKAGMVRLGEIAIDGTKLAGDASHRRSRRYERLTEKELEWVAQMEKLLSEAAAIDAAEDRQYGPDQRREQLPEELSTAKRQLAQIRLAKQELEREAREKAEQAAQEKAAQQGKPRDEAQNKRWQRARSGQPAPKTQANLTDPESRLVKDGATKAIIQGYNAQAAADGAHQIIVAQTVTQQANDKQQLTPMLAAVEENVGPITGLVTADAGYWNEESLQAALASGVDVLVPPDGGKTAGKQKRPANAPQGTLAQQMRERLATESGKKEYRRRGAIIEPVFGHIKQLRGYRRFSFRGLRKVQAEWGIICMAMNLRKLFRYQQTAPA